MKKQLIEVGGTYLAKVGAKSVEVRIDGANPRGGWNATAVGSGKPVRVKDAKHLRPVEVTAAAAAAGESGDPDLVPLTRIDKESQTKRAGKKRGKAEGKAEGKATAGPKARKAKPAAAATKGAAPTEKAPKKLSCLDAAAEVLKAEGKPMQTKAMVEAMATRGLWSTNAPTPAATLYSAILRELKKGAASRFRKTGPGHFDLNPGADGASA